MPRGGVVESGESAGKRLYPLVKELAADGVPVAVFRRYWSFPERRTTAG